MKQLFVVLALAAGFAVAVPAIAQANHPSYEFAEASLRGQTANSPDNDAARLVNWIQANCWNDARTAHINIVQVIFYQSVWYATHGRYMWAHFRKANGDDMDRLFWAQWFTTSIYGDDPESNNQCTKNV